VNFTLFNDIHGLAGNGTLDAVMRFSAQYLLFVVVGVLGLLLLARLRSDGLRQAVRDALWPATGLLLSYALGLLAAALHPEARPFTTHPRVHPLIPHHPGQAFPSDHSTAAFAVALVVLAFLSRRIGLTLLATAALIGFSRVYVGVHYPADILASLVASILGVGVVFGAHTQTRAGRGHARASGRRT
jgi:undecaprenyl-diphosphatase